MIECVLGDCTAGNLCTRGEVAVVIVGKVVLAIGCLSIVRAHNVARRIAIAVGIIAEA